MKNYMVTHTFKSAEMKAKFTETVASMKMEDIIKSMCYHIVFHVFSFIDLF